MGGGGGGESVHTKLGACTIWGGGGTRECAQRECAHKIRRMYDMSVHIKLGACTTWGERECAHQIRSMYNMGGGDERVRTERVRTQN